MLHKFSGRKFAQGWSVGGGGGGCESLLLERDQKRDQAKQKAER